jgi:ATP-dependent helicase/nuclease subunit A
VALTRAADRLIVSGVRPKERKDGADPRPANCWHRIVEQAMRSAGSAQAEGYVALKYGVDGGTRLKRAKEKVSKGQTHELTAPPKRARAPAATEMADLSAITVDDESARRRARRCARRAPREPGSTSCSNACRPSNPARARRLRIDGWSDRPEWPTPRSVRRLSGRFVACCPMRGSHACLLMDRSAKPACSDPAGWESDSRNRRPLLVEDEHVFVIDFKTGGCPPPKRRRAKLASRLMAAYSEALQVIFPGRRVTASSCTRLTETHRSDALRGTTERPYAR